MARTNSMTVGGGDAITLPRLDDATRRLVQLAAVIAAANEQGVRSALSDSALVVPGIWVEELILQSYLFSGFPRALNAMREWRRITPEPVEEAPRRAAAAATDWRAIGEATCRRVYGAMYERLRVNIRALHPILDDWMVIEGYGKVLSRPGLDLPRRELCIVAACAASGQERQLHSHLHGALNVGVAPEAVSDAIDALDGLLGDEARSSTRLLWARVRRKQRGER